MTHKEEDRQRYLKQKSKPKNPKLVKPFVGNVFGKPIGKVPHFLDPRRDYQEREQLAMMAR